MTYLGRRPAQVRRLQGGVQDDLPGAPHDIII